MSEHIPLHQSKATYVSRMTAAVPAGIATLRVFGTEAKQIVLSCFTLACDELVEGRIHYGTWPAETNDLPIGATAVREQVVVCRVSPTCVDIHGHGGRAVCNLLIDSLCQAGATKIAASNMLARTSRSPLYAETAAALLHAKTDRAAGILLDQHNGNLKKALELLLGKLVDNELAAAKETLQSILRWNSFAKRLIEGWQIVLAGPPNVGKSSLLNAITGSTHSIVHSQAGTTRDWVQVETAIDGWPISLSDTAGIREACDAIESQGIDYAHRRIAAADVMLFVVDASNGWTSTHEQLRQAGQHNAIFVINKSDLGVPPSLPAFLGMADSVQCSCVTQEGIDLLLRKIVALIVPEQPGASTALAVSASIRDMLQAISDCLNHVSPDSEQLANMVESLRDVLSEPRNGLFHP